MLLPTILSFIFGAVVGSFLNVVSLRFNTGVGLGGRRNIIKYSTSLTWKELVPILSFMYQKGACKNCKSKISWQYPLIEFIGGAIFALIFIMYPPISYVAGFQTLLYVLITCLLLVMSVYDIKHKIIPDQFVYTFAALALVNLFVGGTSWWHVPGFWALIAGPLAALPFAFLWLISRGAWMGFGDAKLMLGIGWILGVSGSINAIILAFWIAAAVSIIWLLVTYKKFKPKTEVPFGPYLVLAMYLVLLFHVQVLDIGLLKDIIVSAL